MVRSFIVLLLLAVFFLAGTVYGTDRGNNAINNEKVETIEMSDNMEQMVMAETSEIDSSEITEPTHPTEKAASIMGAAVTGFYEVVVQILYQVSQLFF